MNASARTHEHVKSSHGRRLAKASRALGIAKSKAGKSAASIQPVNHAAEEHVEREDRGRRYGSRLPQRVLQLDVTGLPQKWITAEEAAGHIVTGTVAWQAGERPLVVLRGGVNAATGRTSELEIPPILALRGQARMNMHDCVPVLTNAKLIRRDRMTCVWCAGVFHPNDLTREHIVPTSRGGRDEWQNVAACCKRCNTVKSNHLASEVGLELAYLPYVPSLYEDLLLRGRHIRADVHEWLASKLPKGSRLS